MFDELDRGSRPERSYDLGPDHFYTKTVDKADQWVGIIEWHWNPIKGLWCGGWIPFGGISSEYLTGHGWTVNSFDPLDLSPSLLCSMCNDHGFIKQGKWVSC